MYIELVVGSKTVRHQSSYYLIKNCLNARASFDISSKS